MMGVYEAAILMLSLSLLGSADSFDDAYVMKYFSEQVGGLNVGCMFEHCLGDSISCLLNQGCRDAIVCDQKCLDKWNSDTSKEKFKVQNCTNVCAWTYVDKTYQYFIRCLASHDCMSFPPIPKTCRAPNIHPLKQLSVKDLQGEWWVVNGLHPVYDCYPCQKLYFTAINQTSWNYSTNYQVYQANGSLSLVFLQTVLFNNIPGSNITLVYDDIGLKHYETWWLIDKAEDSSFILMYYCGNTLQWNYEGALVLARNTTLSTTAYRQIAASYNQAVGLDTDSFCSTSTHLCPEK